MLDIHRHIQIHNIMDSCEAKAAQCRRGATNLTAIGNLKGAVYMLDRAEQCERIVIRCKKRLGLVPPCSDNCTWRMKYDGFTRQRNALRMETSSMILPFRCGWKLKDGRIGGEALDYEPCQYLPGILNYV